MYLAAVTVLILVLVVVLVLVVILIVVLIVVLVLILVLVVVLILVLVIHGNYLRLFFPRIFRKSSLPQLSAFILCFEEQTSH